VCVPICFWIALRIMHTQPQWTRYGHVCVDVWIRGGWCVCMCVCADIISNCYPPLLRTRPRWTRYRYMCGGFRMFVRVWGVRMCVSMCLMIVLGAHTTAVDSLWVCVCGCVGAWGRGGVCVCVSMCLLIALRVMHT